MRDSQESELGVTSDARGFRRVKLDPALDLAIQRHLLSHRDLNSSANSGSMNFKSLAASVLKMSDFYRDHPSEPTPWSELWCQQAQLAYFLPLNFARARAVAWEVAQRGFFRNLRTARDFGSGLGVMEWALRPWGLRISVDEISTDALRLAQQLGSKPASTLGSTDLLMWSYSLTEEVSFQQADASALLIIEPSLKSDARRLQRLREDLVQRGWKLAGPCTHYASCPLLLDERDWCHDRIHFEAPSWFRQLESHLPIKNETLTFSFLAATKQDLDQPRAGRLVGDFLEEKGKSRILLCRSEKKETLAWLHRELKPEPWSRGTLIDEIPEGLPKGPELRLTRDLTSTGGDPLGTP